MAGTRHVLRIRDHEIPVDASAEGGSKDEGPTPHDLYEARSHLARRSPC